MELCRREGLKATHQRREILREVVRTDEHPDAETVYRRVRRRLPTVSPDTVYRTLALLEEHGLLSRLELFTARARYDANVAPHHHLICTECGRVQDFSDAALDALVPPKTAGGWGEVRSSHVQLRGVCAHCLAKGKAKSARKARSA
jgi:Fur family peroxide stress response transcriptional regulator